MYEVYFFQRSTKHESTHNKKTKTGGRMGQAGQNAARICRSLAWSSRKAFSFRIRASSCSYNRLSAIASTIRACATQQNVPEKLTMAEGTRALTLTNSGGKCLFSAALAVWICSASFGVNIIWKNIFARVAPNLRSSLRHPYQSYLDGARTEQQTRSTAKR